MAAFGFKGGKGKNGSPKLGMGCYFMDICVFTVDGQRDLCIMGQ